MQLLWLAAVVLAAVPAIATADAIDRTSRVVDVSGGMPIRLDATIADVTIVGSDRENLAIEIVRRAPSADRLALYPVAIDQQADGVHISVVQADQGRDASLKTEITIAAPASAVFQAIRVFEGRVKVTNVRGACDVDLRRGTIEAARLAGRIRLEAGLGGVDVRDSDLTAGGMMRLRVFNGPVRVRFAKPPVNGRILAVTFNGRLTSDIPLTMKDKFGPRFGETTLGTGDPVMSIDVVKGDIAITTGK
ncbi:MAG TPA: hypothetical protein VGJ29_04335 [Vicinamibacterales bacterium]